MSASILWKPEVKPSFGSLPDLAGGVCENKIYDCNNGSGMKIFTAASEKDMLDYTARLCESGYFLRADRTAAGNRFITLTGGGALVQVNFIAADNEVRVVFEPDAHPLPSEQPPYEKRFTPELHGLSLDQSNIDCGMSYILKNSDGSLFIIDGGYFTPGEDERLYDRMCALTPPGEEIIISGWFFSHVHQDHVGCFMDFTRRYSGKFRVEGFYFNFPGLGLPEAADWRAEDTVTTIEFYELMKKYYSGVPSYKIMTGQVFRVRDIEAEVLFSHENIYPQRIGNNNDASTVIAVTVRGQRILFLGDASEFESKLILNMYGDYIKSDIVQVAHHGFNGADVELYRRVDPATVLWPTADYCLKGDLWRSANNYLAYDLPGADHFISGFGSWGFPLPHLPGSVKDNSDRFPDRSEVLQRQD